MPPLRSLICFNFQNMNSTSVNLCVCRQAAVPMQPPLEVVEGVRPPMPLMLKRCRHRSSVDTASPWIGGFTCFMDSCAPEIIKRDAKCLGDVNNILGRVDDDDEPVAQVIVDIIGPDSYSGTLCLLHSDSGLEKLTQGCRNLILHLQLRYFSRTPWSTATFLWSTRYSSSESLSRLSTSRWL